MSKKVYDQNIITGFLAGGFGIMLYEIFKVWYGTLFVKPLSRDEFNNEIFPMVFAGFLVALFAICYAVLTWKIRKKETTADNH
jgi:hypothetical protein